MSKAAVLDAAEKVIDETIEVVEAAERIPKLWLNGTTKKQQILILSITALSGAAAGTATSFLAFKKRFEKKYSDLAAQEIAEAKQFYQAVHDKPDLATLAEGIRVNDEAERGLREAAAALNEYQAPKVPEAVTSNIFVEGQPMDDNFDYEAEIAQRSETEPYIISKDEYNQNEKDYEQVELTFYEGDDVLADEKSKNIPDVDDVVGNLNMHRFGHGSGDNNIVYIRNDRLEQDYVVLRSMGEYTKEVLGLRHSDRPGSRKTRKAHWGDDE